MYRRRKMAILISLIVLAAIVFVVLAILLFRPSRDGSGGVETRTGESLMTYTSPTEATEVISEPVTEPVSLPAGVTLPVTTTAAPTTTGVMTAEDLVIQSFIREANTYQGEGSSQASRKPPTGFFHVVTDGGTVSDSNSLDGLTGAAKTVGEVILAAGFRYDKNQNIFYSETQSWQRNFGFTPAYDAGAALTGMYYDTIRINFNYRGNDWRFQLWKGRYGITTGAEMGVYYKDDAVDSDFIYACVPDDEMITMSYAIYKGDELYMVRGPEKHWWLTGFRLFDMIAPSELTMHATFFLEEPGMAQALEKSLLELGFVEGVNYQRLGLTMTIVWK